jgi:hypothetical protein
VEKKPELRRHEIEESRPDGTDRKLMHLHQRAI